MDELLSKAEELGNLLAANERFRALMAARDKVKADEPAKNLMIAYEQAVRHIEELMGGNRPVETDDKRRLAQLEQQVASNDLIKELARAQADFSELLNNVNRAIFEKIAPSAGGESEEDSQGGHIIQ